MTEKLKSCPFCGGKDFLISEWKDFVSIKCGQCETKVGALDEKTAVEYWNTRPSEEELEKEIKRLREALELIAKSNFYFARGEEEKQIRRVCEIAEEALKG